MPLCFLFSLLTYKRSIMERVFYVKWCPLMSLYQYRKFEREGHSLKNLLHVTKCLYVFYNLQTVQKIYAKGYNKIKTV